MTIKAKMHIPSIILALLLFFSCGGYDDSALSKRVSDLESRLTALETKVNTNTSSLQALADAVKNGDSITGFKELSDKSGYVISFKSGGTITILHGTDGKTPVIGVKADSDGTYYWTVDGEWLLAGGKKVKAEGKDAVTPTFKIDNKDWYVSYDGGQSWTKLGKATGDEMFKSVTVEDGCLKVVLADGSALSIPLSNGGPIADIQSFVYVPGYQDGMARIFKKGGVSTAVLKFEVLPEDALHELYGNKSTSWASKAAYTRTRATAGDIVDLPVTSIDVTGCYLTVVVDCSSLDKGFFSGDPGASVSVHVTNGIGTLVSQYIPLVYGGEIVKSNVFDPSNIVFSAGVVSDVHINNGAAQTNKWKNALTQLRDKAAEQDPHGLASVLIAGDLIDNPNTSYLETLKSTYESVFDPTKVPMIYTVGNHDVNNYRWTSSMVSQAAYMRSTLGNNYFLFDLDKEMGVSHECRHCKVGDYHVLAITPNGTSPVVYDPEAIKWLDETLAAITSAEPDKYVIVITHPMIYNTVYGSLLGEADGVWSVSSTGYWATRVLTDVFKKYPQVIDFGGHLHFPLQDPRSIWQGDFTVLGCASVRYMAIEAAGYEDMSSTTVMKDCNEFSQGNLLQFDKNGNMRVLRMDFYNNAVIGDVLTAQYPDRETKANLVPYNHTTRSLANAAPKLSDLIVSLEDGIVTAKWAAGTDDEFVHDYTVTLKQGGNVIATKKILADFYKYPQTSSMKKEYSLALGAVSASSPFEVTLVAADSWGATATLSKTIDPTQNEAFWTGDEAGSKVVSGGEGSVSSGWLSYSAGKLSWTANTTGSVRTAQIILPNGATYSVTQIGVNDFKGDWTFVAKVFGGAGALTPTADPKTFNVSIAGPRIAQSLVDASGVSHTNNIGITGLFGDAVLDGCVDIDYEAMNVRIGLFLDTRDGAGQVVNGKYATFFPGLCTLSSTAWGQPWIFYETEQGNPDYSWLWFTVSEDFKTFTYKNRTTADIQLQTLTQYSSSTMNAICGFGVVLSGTNVFNRQTVSSYANFFQLNPKGYTGEFFERK